MIKKVLAFSLVLCLIISIVGVSFAEFDLSVFEDNEKFTVKIDPMDDSGSVLINQKPFSIFTSKDNFIIMETKIMLISESPASIMLTFHVFDSNVNAENVIFLPDKTRYTTKVISNKTENIENIGVCFTLELLPMIKEIIDKEITLVKCRLSGKNNIDGDLKIDVENLKTLYEYYEKAGGMEQDFSLLDIIFPVTVK